MRAKLIDDGVIEKGSAPSYFLEGLLYNVPNEKFGTSYGDTFVAAMNWLINQEAPRDKLVCANEQYYLVRDSAQSAGRAPTAMGLLTRPQKCGKTGHS
jgi:hypothetical protein